jgi:transposase
MKKVYTATFKAQAVLDILKDEHTIPQLAAKYGVAPTVLRDWRAVALKGLPDLFTARDSTAALQATHEQQLEALYGEIGRLTTQLNFLKKRLPS